MPGPDNVSGAPAQRGLPGLLVAAAFVLVAIAPLIAAAISGVAPADVLTEFSAAFGLVAAALIYLQFWSSGRYETLSGRIGIDQTMGFHRISAFALILFALAHPLSSISQTALQDPMAAMHKLQGLLASPRLATGVAALAALLALTAMAVWRSTVFRRYETWRALHGLLAVATAALTLHHTLAVGTYAQSLPALILWWTFALSALTAILTVYILRPINMSREHWRIDSVTPAGNETWRITLLGPSDTTFRFSGGQFIWLTCAPKRAPLHDHPFSIASSPADLPRLRLLVREAGDCTNDFGSLEPGTRVAIDGPHGSFTLPPGNGPVLLIAGGVGIAPILGLLEHAASANDRRKFVLLFADRTESALSGRSELDALRTRIDLDVRYFADQSTGVGTVKPGPITRDIIAGAIASAPPATWTAFLCGPTGMTERLTDALCDLGLPAGSIIYERFDYAAGAGRLDRRRRMRAYLILAAVLTAITAFALRGAF